MRIPSVSSPTPGQFIFNSFSQAKFVLSRKTKPEFCPDCSAHLGGNYVRKDTTKKLSVSVGDTVSVSPGTFSVCYHQHNRSVRHLSSSDQNVLLFVGALWSHPLTVHR